MRALGLWRRRIPVLAGAVLFAGVNLALFFSYRSSSETRRDALEARRAELQRTVEARETEAARISAQKERLSGVSDAISEFYGRRIGTQRETLDDVVAEVHSILKETGVSTSQISYNLTPAKNLPIDQMHITFAVRCDYARFKRLLKAIEGSRRWLAIRAVSINRDAEQPGAVQVQVDLVTYFDDRESPAGTAPAAASAVPVRQVKP
jgi:Tfp pilus assembly protein PilO